MSKYTILMFISVFILILTFILNDLELQYLQVVDESFVMPSNAIDGAFAMLNTLGKLLTFQVNVIPTWLNALITIPIYMFMILLIINWIRGVE